MKNALCRSLLSWLYVAILAGGCADSPGAEPPLSDAGHEPDGATLLDSATLLDGATLLDSATEIDATAEDHDAARDASVRDGAFATDAMGDADASTNDSGDAATVARYADEDCDGTCSDTQACMREGDHYVCIECIDSSPPRTPRSLTLTTVEQAAALRGYARLYDITIPDVPEAAAILDNLVCVTSIYRLKVGSTDDVSGLRNLQVAQVLDLSLARAGNDPLATNPSLAGLRSLQSVYQTLTIQGNDVDSLHGLEALTWVGDMTLNVGATSIAELSSLTTITGTFQLPTGLVRIDAPALEHVGGLIAYAPELTTLDGLPRVTASYETRMLWTPNLTSAAALSGLRHVTGDVFVDAAVALDGLQNLAYVDGNVMLGQVCRPFRAPRGLRSIGGDLRINWFTWVPRGGIMCITGGDTLADLSQLQSIGGSLQIAYSSLENLDGLEQLRRLGGLTLYENQRLTRIDALRNVQGIMAGELMVQLNRTLGSPHGLEGVTDIVGRLSIHWNDSLTSLDGLSSLTALGSTFTIGSNPMLPNCQVSALAQRVSANCACPDPQQTCGCSVDCLCYGNNDYASCDP